MPPETISMIRRCRTAFGRIRVLAHVAIDPRQQPRVLRLAKNCLGTMHGRAAAPYPSLCEEPLAVVALDFAGRDVVANGVAENVVVGVGGAMRRPPLPMTSARLDLVVQLLRELTIQTNVLFVADQCVGACKDFEY